MMGRGSWLQAARVYRDPRMVAMTALGFSSGLPFLLVFGTLSAWLGKLGLNPSTIGMLSWATFVYALKFLWAPVVDRLRLPLIGRALGQRRSWMLLGQAGMIVALVAMSGVDPRTHVLRLAAFAVLLAFCSATQDITIDAWRIESAPTEQQGAMAAVYQLGYRIAMVASGAGALWIAADFGWQLSYEIMAALVGVGVVTVLLVREPPRRAPQVSVLTERRVIEWLDRRAHWARPWRQAGAWLLGAVVCPVIDFFTRMGMRLGALLFAFIGVYLLTQYAMGVMANPFYLHLGFTLKQIAAIVKIYGTIWGLAGALLGGSIVARLGLMRTLVLGSCLIMVANLAYAALAAHHVPSEAGLATVISLENFSEGVQATALIAFASSLTSASYTATQYAALSSLYALPPKIVMGFSGFVVDAIGYPSFFVYTAALSVPGLLLLWWLWRRQDFRRTLPAAAAA